MHIPMNTSLRILISRHRNAEMLVRDIACLVPKLDENKILELACKMQAEDLGFGHDATWYLQKWRAEASEGLDMSILKAALRD